jgi:tripartite-type tricarboxylate transporter receptor subunit TctC
MSSCQKAASTQGTSAMLFRAGLCLQLLLTIFAVAHAENYPSRPVRLVVTVEAGGTADTTARYLAKQLSNQLQQAYVVVNKPGISGVVAVENVSTSKPDGYTLLYAADVLAIAPSSIPDLSVDMQRDLTPITLVGIAPFVFVVNPRIPVKTPQELVAYIKRHPGGFRWGIGGPGTAGQLAIERFSKLAGINALEVPYKGNAPATMATLSGEVDGTAALYTTVKALVESGDLTVLGVAAPAAVSTMPGVPTIASSGFQGYEAESWFGVWGPKDMPAELATKIRGQFAEALETPELRDEYGHAGFVVTISKDPAEFASFFKSEMAKDKAILAGLTSKP